MPDPNVDSVGHCLKLANGFEEMLSKQTGTMVQLACTATIKGMDEPEKGRLLADVINALTYARASNMLLMAMCKKEKGTLEFNEETLIEMENLEDKRDSLLKLLTAEKE